MDIWGEMYRTEEEHTFPLWYWCLLAVLVGLALNGY